MFESQIMEKKISPDHYSILMKDCFKKAVKEFDIKMLKEPVWTPNGDTPGLICL